MKRRRDFGLAAAFFFAGIEWAANLEMMPIPHDLPDDRLARELVVQALGLEPVSVRRFPTGYMHYVYEATFATRPSVVVRIAAHYGHAAMHGVATLSRLLHPRGVPLPEVLAENLDHPFPHLLLERLPGCDLGDVIGGLPVEKLEGIAKFVVEAQRITSKIPVSVRKYGYAVTAEDAPQASWLGVLSASIERSRGRIVANKIFDVSEIEPLAAVLHDLHREIEAIPATPFLHDTTTKNVIVSPEGICSGIVDVDDLCFGDPRFVVALTRVALLSQGVTLDYTDAWMRIAGIVDDRLFRLYDALFLADFMSERGERFNGNERVIDSESNRQIHALYREALARI